MIGTIIKACAIRVGSSIGSVIKRGLKPKYEEAIFTSLGVAAMGLGLNAAIQNIPNSNYPVLFIVSMALGAVIGTALNLEERFKKAVSKRAKNGTEFARGLSTAIMLFCVGTLSILGPINSALYGDETFLLTNATLDFVSFLAPYMSGGLMTEIGIVGGLLILATGINLLKIKEIPTMNMLPALFVPPIWFAIVSFVGSLGIA